MFNEFGLAELVLTGRVGTQHYKLLGFKFPSGKVMATRGAVAALSGNYAADLLERHLTGDWGNVCEEDRKSNDDALANGGRILSAYPIDPSKPCEGFGDNTIWIITEWDRSVTTVLLPEEY